MQCNHQRQKHDASRTDLGATRGALVHGDLLIIVQDEELVTRQNGKDAGAPAVSAALTAVETAARAEHTRSAQYTQQARRTIRFDTIAFCGCAPVAPGAAYAVRVHLQIFEYTSVYGTLQISYITDIQNTRPVFGQEHSLSDVLILKINMLWSQ